MEMTFSPHPVRHGLPCALQQHPLYGQAVQRMGGQVEWLIWQDTGHPIAQAQCLTRPLGPLNLRWVPREVRLLSETSICDCKHLEKFGNTLFSGFFDKRKPNTFRHIPLVTHQSVAELDLTLPETERLSGQHGKWRNRLRKALTSPLTLRHTRFDPDRHSDFVALEAAQRKARRYRTLPPAFLAAWTANAPHATLLTTAHLNGELSAFMITLLHPPVATYHIGWSGAAGRDCSAHHRLLWEISNRLANRGYTRLDLGSLCTETAPGLARFKIGSGAHIRQLRPTCIALPRLFRPSRPGKRAFPLANRATPR